MSQKLLVKPFGRCKCSFSARATKRTCVRVAAVGWDPEGILGAPTAGHNDRRMMQKQMDANKDFAGSVQMAKTEARKQVLARRAARTLPDDNENLVESAEDLEYEAARCRESSQSSQVCRMPTTGGDLQTLIDSIPFRRLAVWGAAVVFAYQLKDFFGIIMGVFIISFVGNSFVDWAQQSSFMTALSSRIVVRRRLIVLLYFAIIFAVVVFFGVATVPDVAKEAADFVGRLQSDNIWVVLVEKTRHGVGDQIMEGLEKLVLLGTAQDLTVVDPGAQAWTAERSIQLGQAVASMLKGYTTSAVQFTTALLSGVAKVVVQVAISFVLAFMFVWDMPSITAGVQSLQSSRLKPIYDELAPVCTVFGQLFGRALEAQARIALVNTALTVTGMWLLQLPEIGLLSLFVFICSFIPIAGCIISTVPIGFVAVTEYGFVHLTLVILMVVVVHFVEGYILNPAIYSAHLKLHPLMVLSVLVIAEHSIGIWGLLLAVPVTVFMLDYCIKYPQSSVTEVGQKELQDVMRSFDGGDLPVDLDRQINEQLRPIKPSPA